MPDLATLDSQRQNGNHRYEEITVKGTTIRRLRRAALVAAVGFFPIALTALPASGAQPSGSEAAATRVNVLDGVFNPIKNVGSLKCLQPAGGSTSDVAVVQATCNGGQAQGWQFDHISGNDFFIINQHSGLCLYMNGPIATGSPVSQAPCTGVSNERWKSSAPPPPRDIVTLMSRAGHRDTNLCLDVPGRSDTEGLAMQIFGCNGTAAQRWIVGGFA